jgi:protein O-GlcNAc transferase
MSENNSTSIVIKNNIRIEVPESLRYMTTFILREQSDWFEDEIHFLRYYIKSGMKIIDIGANYGLYTLTLSNLIGRSGKIWAFEPTRSTSSCLRKSILKNNFHNINLIQAGLSNRCGKAKLYVSLNSELNSLSKEAAPTDKFEKISLMTLDHCKFKFNWKHIDFIKLDAEGEEIKILQQGHKTLTSLSPLIMFELKHGKTINLPLITQFQSMGYNCYRLVPGLNTLIKFNQNEKFDGFLLNLFCCKKDKEKLLEKEGVIVNKYGEDNIESNFIAHEFISDLAFWEPLKINLSIDNNDDSDDYLQILNLYIMSLSETASSSTRVSCLMAALKGVLRMIDKGENQIVRLTTFSRIAFDAGERTLGVKILFELIKQYFNNTDFAIDELFLPASPRYQHINPNGKNNEWLFSSIVEQYIEKHAFSSYFSKQHTLPLFNKINSLGFIDENMKKRHELVKNCYES